MSGREECGHSGSQNGGLWFQGLRLCSVLPALSATEPRLLPPWLPTRRSTWTMVSDEDPAYRVPREDERYLQQMRTEPFSH